MSEIKTVRIATKESTNYATILRANLSAAQASARLGAVSHTRQHLKLAHEALLNAEALLVSDAIATKALKSAGPSEG